MIQESAKTNIKRFEAVHDCVQKAIVFMNDLHGGLLKFGWICQPNNLYNIDNLTLFVDNLFTYGTGYIDFEDTKTVLVHRKQRIKAIREINMIIKILHKNKEEIKSQYQHQKGEDDSLYQLLMVCFKETTKFFDNLKKQLKKAEL